MLAHLLQSPPGGLLHVDSGPQHVVEGGQEVMADVQGELLDGLHLSDGTAGRFKRDGLAVQSHVHQPGTQF